MIGGSRDTAEGQRISKMGLLPSKSRYRHLNGAKEGGRNIILRESRV